ncbi:hypothetical protein CEXT_792021 [Caerostris extrusa]|uniref:Uncharacterized protein n=1 Tax=Caerostris extrusa TaxID=172846 RepID=A0AAV4MDM0_CAEEX|nr:hypothetical protein CEXT_792021 [Caerostris extrusa]
MILFSRGRMRRFLLAPAPAPALWVHTILPSKSLFPVLPLRMEQKEKQIFEIDPMGCSCRTEFDENLILILIFCHTEFVSNPSNIL